MVSHFRVDVCNIRGLRKNFFAVYVHAEKFKPAIFALNETQVGVNTDPSEFYLPGYSLVPLFVLHHGVAIYIRKDV